MAGAGWAVCCAGAGCGCGLLACVWAAGYVVVTGRVTDCVCTLGALCADGLDR